jgi:thiol-disulfide isomerase/thioredoxin
MHNITWLLLIISLTAFSPNATAVEFPLQGSGLDGQIIQIDPAASKKPILLVFWASWCTRCVNEIPVISSLFSTSSDKITIISCNINTDVNAAKEAIAKHHIAYPVIADKDMLIADKFAVEMTPSLILIDVHGEIIAQAHTVGQLRRQLSQLGIKIP